MNNDFMAYVLSVIAVMSVASISGLLSEKAGVVNIAIEGMMTFGAMITAIIGSFIDSSNGNSFATQFWIVLVVMVATGLFSMLHAFPSITLKSNQVVSGTALNVLAAAIGIFVVSSGQFGTSTSVLTTRFRIIYIGDVLPIWLLVGVFAILIVFGYFKFTKWGMRYQMVGENPNAVDAAGISVYKYRYLAVFLSGCFAGMAGSIFILTPVGNLTFNGSTMGWGFLALGIMIFGQWKIEYISLGVILFSVLFGLGNQLSLISSNQFIIDNYRIFKITPFILCLATMAIFSKKNYAPAADGQPFDKSKR